MIVRFFPSHIITLALAFGLVLSSCSGGHDYAESFSPEKGCWEMADSVMLSIDIEDTTQQWNLVFPLEFNEDYPYSNLYVQLTTRTPKGESGKSTFRFTLMDEMGNWYGTESGANTLFSGSVGPGVKFQEKGKYTFVLKHFMRDDQLCGVLEAGIALDKLQ